MTICEHGRDARKCEVCELVASEAECERLRAEVARLRSLLAAARGIACAHDDRERAVLARIEAEGG